MSKARRKKKTESIDHLVYSCTILAQVEYKERLDKIGHYIHWKICKCHRIPNSGKKWYSHQPEPITEAK